MLRTTQPASCTGAAGTTSGAAADDPSHAIMIGASMAGLLTARILVENFDRVTLIDRDRLSDAVEQRAGVLGAS